MPTLQNVNVAHIEASLKQLWDTETAKSKINASLFNLIIYTHEERRTSYFEQVVHFILEKYPCRIIFVKGDKENPHILSVDVSNEPIGKGNVLIACDQITIHVGVKELHRVPSMILPLLIPDLPIHLLWGQDPTKENPILSRLEEFSRRLIFDSECTTSLQHFSTKMGEKLERGNIELCDITWALISGLRDALSTVFYLPSMITQLKSTLRLEIIYNSFSNETHSHPNRQAIYLQGWLASQLGWHFEKITQSDGKIEIDYGETQVVLIPSNSPRFQPGEILNIEFTSKNHHFVQVSRGLDVAKLIVHLSTLEHCDLPYTIPLPDLQRGFAFLKEILYHQSSCHYREMLALLAKIDWSHS